MHTLTERWKFSSAGRASALQAEGHRFEPYNFHQKDRVSGFFIADRQDERSDWWKATRFCHRHGSFNFHQKDRVSGFFIADRQDERSEWWKATRFCRRHGSFKKISYIFISFIIEIVRFDITFKLVLIIKIRKNLLQFD